MDSILKDLNMSKSLQVTPLNTIIYPLLSPTHLIKPLDWLSPHQEGS